MVKASTNLNKNKCLFGMTEVKYLGVIVSAKGLSPNPDTVQAVQQMEPLTDVSGVRRFLGMVTHVARFLPHISESTTPIRELLNKRSTWVWGPAQQAAFAQVKVLLTSERCMAMYHPSYANTVSMDASSFLVMKLLFSRIKQQWSDVPSLLLHIPSLLQNSAIVKQRRKHWLPFGLSMV